MIIFFKEHEDDLFNSSTMFIFTNLYFKRRFSRHLNITDDYSINRIHTLDISYNTIKDTSSKRKKEKTKFDSSFFFSFNKNTNQSDYNRCFDYKFYNVNHCFISI
jgi:hypothetical protein